MKFICDASEVYKSLGLQTKRQYMRHYCNVFFDLLANELWQGYEVIGSCNKDFSRYLIPFGTADEITYYSKPIWSFRISDHWNWWASLKKCSNPGYVQCRSLDMPWVRTRKSPEGSSEPQAGIQVAICDADGIYHHVYGELFDRKTKKWCWIENKPEDIIKQWLY